MRGGSNDAVIFESGPWRRDLIRDAATLERWLAKKVSESRSIIIEKKVFLAAYAMRRLLQSDKLSSSTETKNIRVDRFPSVKPLEKRDRWKLHEHYDFEAGSPAQITVPRLLNLIIHSFVFQEWYDDITCQTSVVFTSDTQRNKFLWLIPASAFVELMRFVAQDDPSSYFCRFDPERGEWLEWRGHGDPPSL